MINPKFLIFPGTLLLYFIFHTMVTKYIYLPFILSICKPVTKSEFTYSILGAVYLDISLIILVNIVLGSILWGFNTTQELVSKIKKQKLIKPPKSDFTVFLTFRFYLSACVAVLICYASFFSTFMLLFNKSDVDFLNLNSRSDFSVPIFIFVLSLHVILTYLKTPSKIILFLQAVALVIVNFIFVLLAFHGYIVDILNVSSLNIWISVIVCLVYPVLGQKITNMFYLNRLCFLLIGKKSDQVRKKLRLLSLPTNRVIAEKRYFTCWFSFMAFSKLFNWIFSYFKDFDKITKLDLGYFVISDTENLKLVLLGIICIIIAIFLTYLFLNSAAHYACLGRKHKQTYILPLDFCILYCALVKPLLHIFYETWSVLHGKSFLGLGATFYNPAEICIANNLPYYVTFISSPSSGMWGFLTVGFPQTVQHAVDGFGKWFAYTEENKLKTEISANNERLNQYMPHVHVLRKVAENPKDQKLLDNYSELTHQNAGPFHTTAESTASINSRDALISEFVNSSPLCKGVCPVSPRSGLAKPEQFGLCLKNAAEKAALLLEQQ